MKSEPHIKIPRRKNTIMVAIPTFRRPQGLERLLKSIECQSFQGTLHVVVADNDAEKKEGLEVVARLNSTGFPLKIESISTPERGISQVRNALSEFFCFRSDAAFLAMIDDDQVVDIHWAARRYDMAQATQADCIASAVLPIFEGEPPNWVRKAKIYQRDTKTNGRVPIIYSTNGIMLSARTFKIMGSKPFDNHFKNVGGGDWDFFLRCRVAGLNFARARESVAFEVYPESRQSVRWAVLRSFRNGQAYTKLRLRHEHFAKVLCAELTIFLGGTLLGISKLAIFWPFKASRVDALCLVARQMGRVAAPFSTGYREYDFTHGK